MALTSAQQATLKAHILANTDPVVVQALASGDAGAIANEYNKNASPDFTVWRTLITRDEIRQNTVWTEYIGRSQGERDCYRLIIEDASVNPSNSNIRQAFTDIFSGPSGATSRAQLAAASKRLASLVEKIFATGTGSDADPGLLVYEGPITYQEIGQALNG